MRIGAGVCERQSRRQCQRHARHHCGPQGQPPAPLQPLRREARLDQARMAHGPPSGRARLWPRMPVGAPTNGRDSSHLGEHSDLCRAQGPSRDSLSQGETTTKDGAGGFPLALWPKPASDWRERAGQKALRPAINGHDQNPARPDCNVRRLARPARAVQTAPSAPTRRARKASGALARNYPASIWVALPAPYS
jgi:hypothetical protein